MDAFRRASGACRRRINRRSDNSDKRYAFGQHLWPEPTISKRRGAHVATYQSRRRDFMEHVRHGAPQISASDCRESIFDVIAKYQNKDAQNPPFIYLRRANGPSSGKLGVVVCQRKFVAPSSLSIEVVRTVGSSQKWMVAAYTASGRSRAKGSLTMSFP